MSTSSLAIIGPRACAVSLIEPQRTAGSYVPRPLAATVRSPARKGNALIVAFVVGFGGWAAVAPLASGAIAPGVISPNSSRRVVQHLEGGIIRDIRTHEGDFVVEGQMLIALEPVQTNSTHTALLAQHQTLLAQKARLEAERNGYKTIRFSEELMVGGNLISVAGTQQQMFETRRNVNEARRGLIRERAKQLDAQIKGQQAQIANLETQLSYIREEVESKQVLLDKGLLQKPEALRLRRNESELLAQKTSFETEISKAKQQIEETNLQLQSADATRLDEIAAEAEKVDNALVDVDERLRPSEDALKRTIITAPVSGTVINMRFKTSGGVVQRGEPILEIVPRDDRLMIEAHVNPNDIPLIRVDQTTQIHLAAYSSRTMPRLHGIVRSISPDRVTDANGAQSYYLARVEIDKDELKKAAPTATLIPGMSAEIIFVTENRTLLQYLVSPLLDVFRRGMREQ